MNTFKFTILTLLFATTVFAQDFEVSPVLMNFNAEPGEIQVKQINLINHSSTPQKYKLKLQDYELDKSGQKKPLPAGQSKRTLADWMTINPSFIELSPNQATTIDVMMTVPKDGFSTKWGMILVELGREQTISQVDKNVATGVLISPRIVVLVKQSPKSNNNYKAAISDLKEISIPTDSTKKFQALVTNIGDNVIDAKVYLSLSNLQTGEEQKFDTVKLTVYPDSNRDVTLPLTANILPGQYVLAAILDYGHRQPLAGTQLMLEIK